MPEDRKLPKLLMPRLMLQESRSVQDIRAAVTLRMAQGEGTTDAMAVTITGPAVTASLT